MTKEKNVVRQARSEDIDQSTSDELNEEELDGVVGGVTDGISQLIAVTQLKSENANNDILLLPIAPKGHTKYRKL